MENSALYDQQFYGKQFDGEAQKTIPLVKPNCGRAYLFFKRGLDIVFSFLGLILLCPLMLVVAALIFIDDPHGSPLYHQKRVGINQNEFTFWKFRSMVTGADKMVDSLENLNEKDGPVFKIKADPRVTRIGRFIRKTSIDELPQLWNILIGDMSLVGPRPPLPREVVKYSEYEKMRLLVKPGLTCFWQVQKSRDNLSFSDWMKLDMKYIQERSLLVDTKLIFATVKVVFTGEGE